MQLPVVQDRQQPDEAGGLDQGAELQRLAAEPRGDQGGAEARPEGGAEGERAECEPGPDRREALADPQEQGDGEQHPDHAAEEHEDHRDPGAERAVAEDVRLHDRCAWSRAPGRRARRTTPRSSGRSRPASPPPCPAPADRSAARRSRRAARCRRGRWRARAPPATRGRPGRPDGGDQADRQVDGEDQPPAGAEEVRLGRVRRRGSDRSPPQARSRARRCRRRTPALPGRTPSGGCRAPRRGDRVTAPPWRSRHGPLRIRNGRGRAGRRTLKK